MKHFWFDGVTWCFEIYHKAKLQSAIFHDLIKHVQPFHPLKKYNSSSESHLEAAGKWLAGRFSFFSFFPFLCQFPSAETTLFQPIHNTVNYATTTRPVCVTTWLLTIGKLLYIYNFWFACMVMLGMEWAKCFFTLKIFQFSRDHTTQTEISRYSE